MHGAIGMASKRKRPIGPTPERLARAAGAIEIGGIDEGTGEVQRGSVQIMRLLDIPIERARARGVISERQFKAAEKFRLHWYRGGLCAPLQSVDMNRIFASDGSFSGMAKTEAQAFHRQRYREAVLEIGPFAAAIVSEVVCEERSLEDVGAKLGLWKSNDKSIGAVTRMLRGALDELAKLWGI